MKTKILATIGPASNKRDVLSKLIVAGVRIFRLNFSHGDSSSFVDLIKTIRELEVLHKTPITILQDLSGPKIRIGTIGGNGTLTVQKGDRLLLGPSAQAEGVDCPYIPFDHPEIFSELEPGDRLVLADGTLQFRVIEQRPDGLFVLEANNNGLVTSRKGLALPGKSIPLPALTEKDKKDLVDGLALGVDAVALSFVQSPEDIREAKAIIRSHSDRDIPVVAKLERRNAVDRLDAILKEVDIVMVARGDLGIECPLPELPAMQKRIIRACNRAAKPVIVATQMLLSMVSSPSPTRAETTDVANAVLDGADCVMLSEETAMGNYPVETVQFMSQITLKAEELMAETRRIAEPEDEGTAEFLAYAACLLAEKANAKSLVAHSLSGASARLLSARRPAQTIHALTPDVTSLKTLNFSWGVLPHQVGNDSAGRVARAERFIASSSLFGVGEDVVITAGQPTSSSPQPRGPNLVKIYRK
ncbi:MAG: pyruvate kinase [Bilophila sp.]